MKKQLIIIGIILAILAGLYFGTPKQKRLSDEELAGKNIQDKTEETSVKEPEKEVDKIDIYYFKEDDADCALPVPLQFDDMDKRFQYQEINALVTLLMHQIPEGYKSAFIPSTYLNQLKIAQGVAYVDLSRFLTLGDGPCTYESRKKQIISTLSQFDTIKEVKLLADGKEITE